MKITRIVEASKMALLAALVMGVAFLAFPELSEGQGTFGGGKGFGGFGGKGFGGKGFGGKGFGGKGFRGMQGFNNQRGRNLSFDLTDLEDLAGETSIGKPYAEVKGTVYDEEGKPAKGIQVLILAQDSKGEFKVNSIGNGTYSYSGLQGGNYVMGVVYKGDAGLYREVPMRNGHVIVSDFDLKEFTAMGKPGQFDKLKNLKEEDQADDVDARLILPSAQQTLYSKAKALIGMKDCAGAVPILKDLTERDPSKVPFWHRLGECHLVLSEYPKAIDAFRKAMELKPESVDYPFGIALALLYQDKFDEAEAMAVQTVAMKSDKAKPAGAEVYYQVGMAVTDKGDNPKKAEALFVKATELDRSHAAALYQLGLTLVATHPEDLKVAKKPLQEFLALVGKPDPLNEDLVDAVGSAKDLLEFIDPPQVAAGKKK